MPTTYHTCPRCHTAYKQAAAGPCRRCAPKKKLSDRHPKPEPPPVPVVAPVPVDRVDAVFEKARADVWAAGLGRVGPTIIDED